jgi:biopolymer transport protein ExbB
MSMLKISPALVIWALLAIAAADGFSADVDVNANVAVPATDAMAEETLIPTKSLVGIFQAGGLLMYPILACSFVLVLFTFERWVSLRRGRVIPKPFVRRFLDQLREEQLDQDDALSLCEENGSAVAKVFAGAVRKWGRPAVEVEQGIIDAGERVTNDLRKYLRIINGVSTVSPLLGLLGTVTGIISAFNSIATYSAMGRPELLAAGIGEALLTTAFGLFVAIPALTLYLCFVGKVDRLIMDIDGLGQQLVDQISAEALSTERSEKRKAANRATKAA